jgi:hypothetical protein
MSLATDLHDGLFRALPATAGAVPAWGQKVGQAVLQANPLEPVALHRPLQLKRMLEHRGASPWVETPYTLPLWLAVWSEAWATFSADSTALPQRGTLQTTLNAWWSKVSREGVAWPAWPITPLVMALDLGWTTLARSLLESPHFPVGALPLRLAAWADDPTLGPLWQTRQQAEAHSVGQATSAAEVRRRLAQGGRVSGPAPLPETLWPLHAIAEWPAMAALTAQVRTDPDEQDHATGVLLARAIAAEQPAVLDRLGWATWLRAGKPVSVPFDRGHWGLDALGQGAELRSPTALAMGLDEVLAPALRAQRPDLWTGLTPGRAAPGPRFWRRAVRHALQGPKGDWAAVLLAGRQDTWAAGWACSGPTARDRWTAWLEGLPPLESLGPWAVLGQAGSPQALLGGPLPWAALASGVRQTFLERSLVAWTERLRLDPSPGTVREVRWAGLGLLRCWQAGALDRATLLPLVWAHMATLAPHAPGPVRRWQARVLQWAQAHPAAAGAIEADDAWAMIAAPEAQAHWEALRIVLRAPPAEDVPRRARA